MRNLKFCEFPHRAVTVYGCDWCSDTARALEVLQTLNVQPRYIDIQRTLHDLTTLVQESDGKSGWPLLEIGGRLWLQPSEPTLRELLSSPELPMPQEMPALRHKKPNALKCRGANGRRPVHIKEVRKMKEVRLTFPELALVVGTRAMLGAGIALLVAEKSTTRRVALWVGRSWASVR